MCDNIFPIPAVTVSGAGSSSDSDNTTDSSGSGDSGTISKPVRWPKIVRQTSNCFDGVLVQYALAKKQKPLKYLMNSSLTYAILKRRYVFSLKLMQLKK